MTRYKRKGECNQCGECCGFPRSTDGGQNNPWPTDWSNKIPFYERTKTPDAPPLSDPCGTLDVGNRKIDWIWVEGHGLCKPIGKGYDPRCPFLSVKVNGKVPCLLYGTKYHSIWKNYCDGFPPEIMQEDNQLKQWKQNCPSCSFEWDEIE